MADVTPDYVSRMPLSSGWCCPLHGLVFEAIVGSRFTPPNIPNCPMLSVARCVICYQPLRLNILPGESIDHG
jgi:hypothetical protein